jgi:hypothetical protein
LKAVYLFSRSSAETNWVQHGIPPVLIAVYLSLVSSAETNPGPGAFNAAFIRFQATPYLPTLVADRAARVIFVNVMPTM